MASRAVTLSSGLIVGLGGAFVTCAASGGDGKAFPPVVRVFQSPAGRYRLEVRGASGWKTPYAQLELLSSGKGAPQSRWSKQLPHRYGPGSALVSDSGHVLLLDEWMKTPGPYAVMVFDANGTEVVRYSVADIAALSGVHISTLITTAHHGPWMSAAPRSVAGRNVVMLEAGKVRLEIVLDSGLMTRAGASDP